MTPEQQFAEWGKLIDKGEELNSAQKLHLAEQVRAIARQMIANGTQKLTPENVAALRELDTDIADFRKRLRRK